MHSNLAPGRGDPQEVVVLIESVPAIAWPVVRSGFGSLGSESERVAVKRRGREGTSTGIRIVCGVE